MTNPATRNLLLQASALVIGTGSGAVAAWAGMPLPWMLGAMLGTTIASMAGLPISSPARLRPMVIPILGVLLGSSLSIEVLEQAVTWLPSVLLMPVFIIVATLICMAIYQRLGGYSPASAFFAAMPGGLNEMILLSAAYGGDERRVAMAHGLRVLIAISAIGLFFGLFLDVSASGGGNWTALGQLSAMDYLWLGGAAVIGGSIGRWLKLPAGTMMLPMLISSVLHVAEVVTVPPPSVAVIVAQIVMGASVGARFAGVRLRDILPDIRLGLISTSAMLLIALGFAWAAHLIAGTPMSQSFLAFAPGGLSEMSLLALAMGQQVAYVSVLHILRIVLVIMSAPVIYRIVRPKP